jgi:hypothetical protein
MTFQEILAEVQKLSDEEKRLLVKAVSKDLTGIAVYVMPDDEYEVWSPEVVSPTLGKGSLQPLYDLLEEANKLTAEGKV